MINCKFPQLQLSSIVMSIKSKLDKLFIRSIVKMVNLTSPDFFMKQRQKSCQEKFFERVVSELFFSPPVNWNFFLASWRQNLKFKTQPINFFGLVSNGSNSGFKIWAELMSVVLFFGWKGFWSKSWRTLGPFVDELRVAKEALTTATYLWPQFKEAHWPASGKDLDYCLLKHKILEIAKL